MSSCLSIVCASSQAVFMAKGLGGGGRERDKRKEGVREGGDQGLSADFKGGTELKERKERGRVNSCKQFISMTTGLLLAILIFLLLFLH